MAGRYSYTALEKAPVASTKLQLILRASKYAWWAGLFVAACNCRLPVSNSLRSCSTEGLQRRRVGGEHRCGRKRTGKPARSLPVFPYLKRSRQFVGVLGPAVPNTGLADHCIGAHSVGSCARTCAAASTDEVDRISTTHSLRTPIQR